ncbi:TPA: hypothetical protein LT076_001647 [Salmonella enterica subsp. enterica serovar Gallinarum]|nr:hypothetical protein [Salmonella enterica subsp. enterica serovar Gallinarum]
MELYVSKTSQQNMPVEFNIYYSRSKTLVGIVFWICMMGVFIALAVSMACDLNAEMGRKTRNLDAITNGQWYLLKAISLPIMQGGLICYDRILCLNIYPQNTK